MIVFLTSSPTGDLDGKYTCVGFDSRNGFSDQLRKVWKRDAKVLMITASPDKVEANAEMKAFFHDAIFKTGLTCSSFDLWEASILENAASYSKEILHSYDVIFLGGGHVPTQQKFFRKLKLRENIQGFEGIVIGISAGTMNCADIVYAQPEEVGEAVDPAYEKFIPGLGLTDVNVLPHYQMTKDFMLDGLKLFEEISIPDSREKEFYALPDGSYVIVENDWAGSTATVYGKAYILKDGSMDVFCEDGDSREI